MGGGGLIESLQRAAVRFPKEEVLPVDSSFSQPTFPQGLPFRFLTFRLAPIIPRDDVLPNFPFPLSCFVSLTGSVFLVES